MAYELKITDNATAGGKPFKNVTTYSGGVLNAVEVAVPAAKAGTLSTRTDNNTGILTVASGHGITTSNKVDVYWSTGRRRGMTVTATTGTTISIDLGSGDNLPLATTAITVTVPTVKMLTVDASALVAFAAYTTKKGNIAFLQDDDTEIYAAKLGDGGVDAWGNAMGKDNPITDDTTKVSLSHGNTAAQTMRVAALMS